MNKCSMALPNLAKLSNASCMTGADSDPSDSKRTKRSKLPCEPELVYGKDEYVNIDSDSRIQGHSSYFRRQPIPDLRLIPVEKQEVVSQQEVKQFVSSSKADGNVQKVIEELYRTEGFDPSSAIRDDQYYVFTETFSNAHGNQYKILTLKTPTVVTHVINGGHFWNMSPGDPLHGPVKGLQIDNIQAGMNAYTAGFLWANTYPNWTWKGGGTKIIARCKIQLPAGSQVLLDYAPVFDEDCQTPEENLSMFPDVLIPPSKFQILSVKRYTAGKEQEEAPRRLSRTSVWTEQEYANQMLEDNKLFVDIQLRVEASWKLPSVSE